jgi:hypothetical protein
MTFGEYHSYVQTLLRVTNAREPRYEGRPKLRTLKLVGSSLDDRRELCLLDSREPILRKTL